MADKNRELSQFSQFLNIDDTNSKIGIATTAMPFVGIGTTNPTSKFFVNGNAAITGILTVGAVRGGGQIGVSSSSTYVGLSTQINFVGTGITITPQFNPLTGITTLTFTGTSGGGSPGGSEGQIQYFSSGVFGGSSNLTFSSPNLNVAGLSSASRFISTVGSGTAPLSVASSTVVTNLNADYLEGYNPQISNIGNSIVLRDIGGNFQAGIITATAFIGPLTGGVTNTTGTSRIETLYGTNVYYSIGYINSGIITSITNTNANLNRVNISGIVTVANNPVLIGVASSTGTQAQRLQVEGKGYFSDSVGIGNTNPSSRLTVTGDGSFSGVVTAASFSGPASYAPIAGYSTISGIATNATVANYAVISGYSTISGIATNVSGGNASVINLAASGISTLGSVTISTGIITSVSGVVTYYGDGSKLTGIAVGGGSSITIQDNTSTNANYYIGIVTTTSGITTTVTVSSTKLTFNPSTGIVSATNVYDSRGDVRAIPANNQAVVYTLVAADSGSVVNITAGVGITVPPSVFSSGDAISVFNNTAISKTVTVGAGVTLRLAGSASVGTRYLSQYALATILCVSSNVFAIAGAGVT